MARKAPRQCRCHLCSQHMGGFKIVSYSTFVRHNPIIAAAQRILPAPLIDFPARERTPSIRYGSLLPDLGPGRDGSSELEGSQEALSHNPEEGGALFGNDWDDDQEGEDGLMDLDTLESDMEGGSNSDEWEDIESEEEEDEDMEEEDVVEAYREARDEGTLHDPNQPPIIANPSRHHGLSPSTRLLFTHAAFAKATGSTNEQCNAQLEQGTRLYEVATGDELPSATNNIRTAQRRLGVHPDQYIDQYIVCPSLLCWNLTPMTHLGELESPICGAALEDGSDCTESIFQVIARAKIPYKVILYCRMSRSLALLLRDAEFVENLGAWRDPADEDDRPGNQALPLDPTPLVYPIDTPLEHVCDGTAWRAAAAHVRRIIEEDNSVTEEALPGRQVVRLSSLPFGMFAKVSIDWFAIHKVLNGSVGALWITWANLPAGLVNKKRFTSLLTIIPGPKEPSKLLFNKVLEPIMEDIALCEQGFFTAIKGYEERQFVQVRVLLNFSDMPATRKLLGSVAYGAKKHPCNYCDITMQAINEASGYLADELPRYDPDRRLQAAFEHEVANSARRKAIEDYHGVRFSTFIRGVGVNHLTTSPPDFMHNTNLGIVKSIFVMLLKNRLFEGERDGVDRFSIFVGCLSNASFPGHLGRLPDRILKQLTSSERFPATNLKADEWKRILQMMPLALYLAWMDDGVIRDVDLDVESLDDEDGVEVLPQSRKKKSRTSVKRVQVRRRSYKEDDVSDEGGLDPNRVIRNRWRFYKAIISLCAGLRIYNSHALSVAESESAASDLSNASVALLNLNCHLTINWHVATHFPEFVKLYGPVSVYSTWSTERNNGLLANISHNGKERDIPYTALRRWIGEAALSVVINNPAPGALPSELAALEALKRDRTRVRGTFLLEEARGNAMNRYIVLPQPIAPKQSVDLIVHNAYGPLLEWAEANIPLCRFRDVADHLAEGTPLPRRSFCYKMFPYVKFNGFKFCSPLYSRTRKDQYALAQIDEDEGRELVKIKLLFSVDFKPFLNDPPLEGLTYNFALVHRYERLPSGTYPWQVGETNREIDLGMRSYDNGYISVDVISVDCLQASTIVSAFRFGEEHHLISISCDREGPEPEFWLEDDQALVMEDAVPAEQE